MSAPVPAWVKCTRCDDWLCTIHGMHVHDCPCPPIDEWETDPYSPPPTPGPMAARRRAGRRR